MPSGDAPPPRPWCPDGPRAEVVALGDRIAELSARIQAATWELLALIRQFDERNGWAGCVSCAEWLGWRTGLAPGAAREHVRVARALADLPKLSDAMRCGKVSYSKMRAITRVATPETEDDLLNVALSGTAAHVEKIVRAWRRVDRLAEQAEDRRRHETRSLRTWVDDDGMVVVRGRLSPEVGAVVRRALEAACDQARGGDARASDACADDAGGEAAAPTGASTVRGSGATAGDAAAGGGAEAEVPSLAQRQADALGVIAECALAGGLDRGTAGDRYQVVLHVDADALKEAPDVGSCQFKPQHVVADRAQKRSTAQTPREARQPYWNRRRWSCRSAFHRHWPRSGRNGFQVVLHMDADALTEAPDVPAGTPAAAPGSVRPRGGPDTPAGMPATAPGSVGGGDGPRIAAEAPATASGPEGRDGDSRVAAGTSATAPGPAGRGDGARVPAETPAETRAATGRRGPGPKTQASAAWRAARGRPTRRSTQPCPGPRAAAPTPAVHAQTVLDEAGGIHVSTETARRLACDAATVRMQHGPGGEILDVGRRTRTISPALRRALRARDHQCRFPGCRNQRCDCHHVRHWADGGATALDNLVLLCRRHHRAVHEEGFRVTLDAAGGVVFRRPDGRPLPEAPAAPAWTGPPLAPATARLERDGVSIGPDTATPDWRGERLDLDWAIHVLWRPRPKEAPAGDGQVPDRP